MFCICIRMHNSSQYERRCILSAFTLHQYYTPSYLLLTTSFLMLLMKLTLLKFSVIFTSSEQKLNAPVPVQYNLRSKNTNDLGLKLLRSSSTARLHLWEVTHNSSLSSLSSQINCYRTVTVLQTVRPRNLRFVWNSANRHSKWTNVYSCEWLDRQQQTYLWLGIMHKLADNRYYHEKYLKKIQLDSSSFREIPIIR